MKHEHFVVQSPATPAAQLILLFHGVGDTPVAMGRLAVILLKSSRRRWWSAWVALLLLVTAAAASGFQCRTSPKKIALSALLK